MTKEHAKQFEVVQNKKLLMERRVELEPGEAVEFQIQFLGRHWAKLGSYPAPANIAVVKEFYANAATLTEGEELSFSSYVRGRRVPFDADTINTFLGTDLELGRERCEYGQLVQAGADHAEIERVVCRPGGQFHRNRQGQPLHIKRAALSPTAMIWLALIHANISPCVHVSDVTEPRSIILYSIMADLSLDLGRLIADEILMCANGVPSAALGHPSLVTHLCTMAGVDTSEGPTERPRHPIDIRYIRQYCLRDAEAIPPPVIEPPPPPAPAASGRQESIRQQLRVASQERAAIMRGQLLLLESFRSLAERTRPPVSLPSAEAFMRLVAWPGGQPIFAEEEGAAAEPAAEEHVAAADEEHRGEVDAADAGAETAAADEPVIAGAESEAAVAEAACADLETAEDGARAEEQADIPEAEPTAVEPAVPEAVEDPEPIVDASERIDESAAVDAAVDASTDASDIPAAISEPTAPES